MSLTIPVSCVSNNFLITVFLAFGFSGISVIRLIIFTRWRDWQSLVRIKVRWYVRFFIRFEESVGRVSGVGSVVFVLKGIESIGDFFCWSCLTTINWVQRWLTHWNILAPIILISPPSLKTIFVTILLFWPCPAHSSCSWITNKMTRREKVGSIRQPFDSVSSDAEGP